MELNLRSLGSEAQGGTLSVSDRLVGAEYNEALIHQVVTAYMAGARSGTKAQKTRSDVRGGGAKPFRQKGLGRARAGSTRGPIWRGGGVTFAARPRDYAQKVNRKMYRAAMRSILSELLRQERLVVVDSIAVASPKTKDLAANLKALNLADVLIVTDEVDENLYLAARNIPHVGVCDAAAIDPVSLVGFGTVVVTQAALKQLEERLS